MFSVLKDVLEGKTITKEGAKKVNDFILRRWLSGDNRLIDLANTLNCTVSKIDSYLVLIAIQKALRGQIKFIKFPSKPKESNVTDENIAMVAKFFEISSQEAQEYLEWMEMHCPQELEYLKKICRDFKE